MAVDPQKEGELVGRLSRDNAIADHLIRKGVVADHLTVVERGIVIHDLLGDRGKSVMNSTVHVQYVQTCTNCTCTCNSIIELDQVGNCDDTYLLHCTVYVLSCVYGVVMFPD